MKKSGSEIIEQILTELDIKAPTFSTNIGIEYQRIYDIQRGKTKKISGAVASAIVYKYPQFNLKWLITGEGGMLREEKPFVNEVTSRPTSDYMMVEYADLRAAAGRIGGGDVSQLPETHRRLVPKEFNNGRFLVVRVDGDSMDDGSKRSLSDGDEVLIKEKTEDKWFDLPIKKTLFVITSREGNVLKQIKEINKDEKYILCHSFNPAYEDFKIFFEDIFQIFIVCKVVQRQISLI